MIFKQNGGSRNIAIETPNMFLWFYWMYYTTEASSMTKHNNNTCKYVIRILKMCKMNFIRNIVIVVYKRFVMVFLMEKS